MTSCMTPDVREILHKMIVKEVPHAIIDTILEMFPDCASRDFAPAPGERVPKRHQPTWGPAKYYDAKGKPHDYTSPSAAFQDLFGVSPASGIDCEIVAGEPRCSPKTMVMSFMSRGMIVRGNGEPPPVIETGMSEQARVALHQEWNAKLKSEGKQFLIYHPEAPQLKALDAEG